MNWASVHTGREVSGCEEMDVGEVEGTNAGGSKMMVVVNICKTGAQGPDKALFLFNPPGKFRLVRRSRWQADTRVAHPCLSSGDARNSNRTNAWSIFDF